MNMTLTIEIPALDRLCGLLEGKGVPLVVIPEGKEERIVDCATTKKAPTTAPEAVEAPQETEKPEATNAPENSEAPAPAPATGPTVTLNAVQKAAAQLRDEGKLEAVKGLFPEFGIRKLSDLTGDALQGFADRLRGMGAKI